MAKMRMIPGLIAAAVFAAKFLGKLVGIGKDRAGDRAPWMNIDYQGGGTVGVNEVGRKATKPKLHVISKIERRKRQKQSIRDRKLRHHTL